MGINVGRSQFHLGTAGRTDLAGRTEGNKAVAQRLGGMIGLVAPDVAELCQRLDKVTSLLKGTQFSYEAHADRVEVTCPWGNRFRCHAPSPEYGNSELAIAYVEWNVPRATAPGIARFYRDCMLALTTVVQRGNDMVTSVDVGGAQKLRLRETDGAIPPYDDHHIAVYVASHSGPHRALKEHDVSVEENNAHQYRFRDIVDPENGKPLFRVEHEVRSLKHPLFNQPLVNREPMAQ